MKNLTERQSRILDFIAEFSERQGMAPTVYEIAEHFQIEPSTAFAHLKALRRKNQLSRSSKARSITLVHPRLSCRGNSCAAITVPVRRTTSGGDWSEWHDEEICLAAKWVSRSDHEDIFALRVDGDAMRKLGICAEDIVVVDPAAELHAGDIVAAEIEGRTLLRSYFPLRGGRIELRAADDETPTTVLPEAEARIGGRVIALQREY